MALGKGGGKLVLIVCNALGELRQVRRVRPEELRPSAQVFAISMEWRGWEGWGKVENDRRGVEP